MLRRSLTMRTLLVAALAAMACTPPPSPLSSRGCLELPAGDGVAVASVGDVPITTQQLLARVREQGSTGVRRYADRAALRQLVEDQIRFELLVRVALERGLAADAEVVQEARKVMVRKLLQHDLGAAATTGEVADSAIAAYYEQHQDEYRQPEKRRLSHIQLPANDHGRAIAATLLERLAARPEDPDFFRMLATQHSQEADSRARGGDLLFQSEAELAAGFGADFARAVFALPPAALAPAPLRSQRGWHVVKVLARREALDRGLDEVREEIRERLLKGERSRQFDRYLAEVRQRYPVALYDDRLDEVLAELTGAGPERSP